MTTHWIADDFQGGVGARPGMSGASERTERSDFSLLMRGQTVGKRAVIRATTAGSGGTKLSGPIAPVNLFTIRGEDENALNLGITVAPPQGIDAAVIPAGADLQQLTGEADNANFVPTFRRLFVILEWGIGGIGSRAVIDCGNGCQFNVMASYARAQLGMHPETTAASAFVVGAFIGPANAAPGRNRFTDNGLSLGAGVQSAILPIPYFAYAVSVINPVLANRPGQIIFWLDSAGTVETGRYVLPTDPGHPLVIPAGSMYYSIINDDGVNRNFRASFELSL